MAFDLPDLPFAYDALAPYMSAETFEFHHDKHHNAYVTNGNKILEGLPHQGDTLEEVVKNAAKEQNQGLFNNAAQHWNHSFFWKCLKPNGGGTSLPTAVQSKIDSDLGGYDSFREKFVEACVTQFGSGWGWVVLNQGTGKLEIVKTGNAGVPFTEGKTPLLTCDVWEHAYYIDYRNARPKYVETFVDNLINWEFVESCL
ncbi:MAG: superoxide dismutase [Rhodospirillales bacterium]|nr:superoxide dismutase [Alphaproteobacteria bacterium]USO03554.1 MAG: superoxide dismutase [Rhodospirillales bacterium]